MEINEQLLKQLTEVNGIAGNEGRVRQLFKDSVADVAEEFVQDGLEGFLRSILVLLKGRV